MKQALQRAGRVARLSFELYRELARSALTLIPRRS